MVAKNDSAYGVQIDKIILYKILYVILNTDMPWLCLQFLSSPFLYRGTIIESFFAWGSFSLFQLGVKSFWMWLLLF